MSDKIKVSTDHLDRLASQLKSLGNKLGSASNKLSGVYMNSTTANHTLRDGSCRLSGKAGVSRVSTGSTYSTVRRYSNVLDEYDDLCKKMAKEVTAVKERFIAIEAELSALANEDAEDIGNILGFPKDTSKWTDKQWNKYMEFANEYNTFDFPGGGKLYYNDGHFVYVSANGRKTEYDFGDFPFFNNPFVTGGLLPNAFGGGGGGSRGSDPLAKLQHEVIERMLTPYAFLIPGTAGEGVLSWLEDKGHDVNSKIELFKGKDEDGKRGLLKDSKGKETDSIKKQLDENGNWVESKEGVQKPKHTFVEVGRSVKGETGWLMGETGIEGENGHVKVKGAVGYAEGEIGAYAGLYGYDEDGNIKLSPGVRAEIGGSVSLLHGEVDAAYDFGPVEVGASGSVDVGKVGGKVEAQLGWVNGDFAANAGFEAEAIAFEAKGSISAGNDYVGVKATGGVQVGIGASGDIGYKDGVISVEFSAAVGLGLSGKVELDIGGTIDAVSDAAVSVAKGAAKAYDGAKNAIKGGLKKLGKLFG